MVIYNGVWGLFYLIDWVEVIVLILYFVCGLLNLVDISWFVNFLKW